MAFVPEEKGRCNTMKPSIKPTRLEKASQGARESNLLCFLSDPRSEEFFGRPFQIKSAVLAHLLTGDGSLAELARKLGTSRQLVHWHASRAMKIYFSPSS